MNATDIYDAFVYLKGDAFNSNGKMREMLCQTELKKSAGITFSAEEETKLSSINSIFACLKRFLESVRPQTSGDSFDLVPSHLIKIDPSRAVAEKKFITSPSQVSKASSGGLNKRQAIDIAEMQSSKSTKSRTFTNDTGINTLLESPLDVEFIDLANGMDSRSNSEEEDDLESAIFASLMGKI